MEHMTRNASAALTLTASQSRDPNNSNMYRVFPKKIAQSLPWNNYSELSCLRSAVFA